MKPVKSSYEYEDLKIHLETSENSLDDIIEAFEHVLRGAGFYFDGHLTIDNTEFKDKHRD